MEFITDSITENNKLPAKTITNFKLRQLLIRQK